MDDIFEDLIEEGIAIIYMDDMFLSAKTKEQLRENTRRVLQRLMENDLYLKPKKMRILQGKDRMVRNGYTGRENHHGSRKTKGDSRLASPHDG